MNHLLLFSKGGTMRVLGHLLTFVFALITVPAANGRASEGLPLVPTRTVSFSASEGTWLSVDLSPDGKTIVFDLLGDLYLLPVSGGVAQRLTSGMSLDAQPRFTPDGRSVLFTSDRDGGTNLWTVSLESRALRQITHEKRTRFVSPAIAADGKSIIVSKAVGVSYPWTPYRLWEYPLAGGVGRALIDGDAGGLSHLGPTMSKSSDTLYFAGFERDDNYEHIWHLKTFDRRSGNTRRADDLPTNSFRPSLSPDGKWLVYAEKHDEFVNLMIRDMTTGKDRVLHKTAQLEEETFGAYTRDIYPNVAFTPDGDIIGGWEGKLWRVNAITSEIRPIEFRADIELQLGPLVRREGRVENSRVKARHISTPSLSPDKKKIVFSALQRLWIADISPVNRTRNSTLRPVRLTQSNIGEYHPAWSPDGRFVTYVTWSDAGFGQIMRVSVDGSHAPEQLTSEAAFYNSPTYSPDGQRIAFLYKSGAARRSDVDQGQRKAGGANADGFQLGWVAADGGNLHTIGAVGHRAKPQFVAGEPDRIYLYPFPELSFSHALPRALMSMRWDGSDRHDHLSVTGYQWPHDSSAAKASEIVVSSNGRQLAVVAETRVHIVDLPTDVAKQAASNTPTPEYSVWHPAHNPKGIYDRRVDTVGGSNVGWSNDGRTLTFALGNALFLFDGKLREFAVDIPLVAKHPEQTLVLSGARLITMRGNEVIEHGDVVVESNRIVAVGRQGEVVLPDHARRIDLSGATVMPGMIDLHSHIGVAYDIQSDTAAPLRAALSYGVTTILDPAAEAEQSVYADMITAGQMIGPRLYSTGPKIEEHEEVNSLADARALVRRYRDYYGTPYLKEYHSGDRRQRQLLLIAAREFGMHMTSEGGHGLRDEIGNVIDGNAGHEHIFPVAPLYGDVTALLAKAGTSYDPTLVLTTFDLNQLSPNPLKLFDDPKLANFVPRPLRTASPAGLLRWFLLKSAMFEARSKLQIASAGALLDRGVRVTLGNHGELNGLGTHIELWLLANGGISTHQALRAATLSGAEAIGLASELGSIEVGKLADLVILNRNPLADIRATADIRWIMQDGRLLNADTLEQVK